MLICLIILRIFPKALFINANPLKVFLGWASSSSATSAQYQPGGNYSLTQNATLYAVWKYDGGTTPTTYTLTYNANGGTGAPSSQTGSGNITISSTRPTRSNYTFLGWATSSSASSAQYQPGATYSLTSNATLYAVWKYDGGTTPTTYTLTYNANGGSGAPSSQTGNGNITISSNKPTRSGYTFLGWATSSSATSAQYQPGVSFNLTKNTTFYAVWKKNDTPSNPTANAKLNVKSSASVDYRANVTITATADNVPSGYVLAIYDGNSELTRGDNKAVSFKAGNMTANRTFTVKVIDPNNKAVQKDSNGAELSKNCEVKVNTGFFAKLIAFFRGLFGSLPNVEIKP